MRVISLPCPHCGSSVRAIKSRAMGLLMKEITYQCTSNKCADDTCCGHVFVASLEVLRTLSLSSVPRSGIRIPLSSHAHRGAADQLALNLTIAEAEP